MKNKFKKIFEGSVSKTLQIITELIDLESEESKTSKKNKVGTHNDLEPKELIKRMVEQKINHVVNMAESDASLLKHIELIKKFATKKKEHLRSPLAYLLKLHGVSECSEKCFSVPILNSSDKNEIRSQVMDHISKEFTQDHSNFPSMISVLDELITNTINHAPSRDFKEKLGLTQTITELLAEDHGIGILLVFLSDEKLHIVCTDKYGILEPHEMFNTLKDIYTDEDIVHLDENDENIGKGMRVIMENAHDLVIFVENNNRSTVYCTVNTKITDHSIRNIHLLHFSEQTKIKKPIKKMRNKSQPKLVLNETGQRRRNK